MVDGIVYKWGECVKCCDEWKAGITCCIIEQIQLSKFGRTFAL